MLSKIIQTQEEETLYNSIHSGYLEEADLETESRIEVTQGGRREVWGAVI